MKIKITLLCILITMCFTTKAQNYVTIPDANFVAWLQAHIPSAMNGNQMDTTSSAVTTLTSIDVENLGIANLFGIQFFDGLTSLICENSGNPSTPNTLTSLPRLPIGLKQLYCSNNHLNSLPPLPNSIIGLICHNNYLTSLPTLPSSLKNLTCYYNYLTNLPALPDSLLILSCQNNTITYLPMLPNMLQSLVCYFNQITNCPVLPNTLTQLFCHNNHISCFSSFPTTLTNSFDFSIANNPFTCLPNYTAAMNSATLAYPLCQEGDLINNQNGCVGSKGILGSIYKDNNSNCNIDGSDQSFSYIHLKLYDVNNNLVSQNYSAINGLYHFPDSAGTYTVVVDTAGMPFYAQCTYPGIDSTVVLTTTNPLVRNVNFSVACKPGFDLGVQSIVHIGLVFPGEQHLLGVVAGDISQWYNFNCTAAGVCGQLQITVNGPLTFSGVSSGAATPVVNGNVYTYTIPDFGNINMLQNFGLFFTINPTAQVGDQICVNVAVLPCGIDNNNKNNNYTYCYNVVNSLDPNYKEVYPIDVQPGFNDYFTYTVHFQNTGTALAMNIRLVDTLNTNLDLETFQVINYSHYNTVSVNGNVLTFRFPNIQLPDSTSNFAGSQGFVQYRIKPKANLPLGTKIKNTANIYFDYNPAIVTNTTTNEFTATASIYENKINTTLSVYPNPSNGKYYATITGETKESKLNIEVYNLLGEVVYKATTPNSLPSGGLGWAIDLSHQPNGIYIIRIKGSNQSLNQRVIKQ
jgi:fimbrial isopeptide formation D2 family protein